MTYTVRPISDRTQFTGKHQRSRFDTAWSTTEYQLECELRHLGARNVVLELDLTEGQIRLDGRPKSQAKVSSPAVRISFDCKHGALAYGTDKYWTWQDNVRALALSLEALRLVDRHGVSTGQQYVGWKAIGSGSSSGSRASVPVGAMTTTTAQQVLLAYAPDGTSLSDGPSGGWERIYKMAQRATHPDTGRDRKHWDAVEAAGAVLGLVR